MAMLVIHGAFRDADAYFCMMHGLMQAQDYRDPKDILIIAPDFSYKGDFGLFKSDAFWNNSHPWGDWRAGAHSDRRSGHGEAISSYHIIDGFMLALNNVSRFPNLNEIAIVGHSAGGQAVQRYALTTLLPPKVKNLPLPHPFHSPLLPTFYLPPPYPNLTPTLAPPPLPPPYPPKLRPDLDIRFIVANPSSYAYLDARRPQYTCGTCDCNDHECDCSGDAHPPRGTPCAAALDASSWPFRVPAPPNESEFNSLRPSGFVCGKRDYDDWPYGLERRLSYPSARPINHSLALYPQRDVIYIVGENDTCNDGFKQCDASCWQRHNGCFRSLMDTRCPAMLEGPWRKLRGELYRRFLEHFYGRKVHQLAVVPNAGHNATAVFQSPMVLRFIFHLNHTTMDAEGPTRKRNAGGGRT